MATSSSNEDSFIASHAKESIVGSSRQNSIVAADAIQEQKDKSMRKVKAKKGCCYSCRQFTCRRYSFILHALIMIWNRDIVT
jgi:hypothetical protein